MSIRFFVKTTISIALVAAFAATLQAFPLQSQAAAAQAAAASVLLILNKAENTLAIVDPVSLKVLGKVPTGEGPHEVVASADGRIAYVANYGTQQKVGNSLSVIDLVARREIKRVELGPLLRPHGIVLSNGKVYFTAEVNRVIARYDPMQERVDWIMGTGQSITHMLVITPDGKRAYTTNIVSGTVTSIDFTVPVPQQVTQIQVGKGPEAIDISPDGTEVWVGQNGEGSIAVIDTATNKVKETIKVGEVPIRVKFTPDGKRVLVSDAKGGELIMLDAATRKELKRLKVAGTPVGILITPDGSRAFVAAMEANKVMVIDLAKLEIAGAIEPGQGPDGLGWAAPSQKDATTQPKPANGAQQ
ncbi:MAG TPA: cytochrome D1 domain-containing protein [Pyrinomonadaceae bacterium]|nr:cytochrome D1 domain-containing protein [Pyrinomonadaceae bacterium]